MYSFPNFEPIHCFMSGSNCCFLTYIQVSQEADKVVWYSHLVKKEGLYPTQWHLEDTKPPVLASGNILVEGGSQGRLPSE